MKRYEAVVQELERLIRSGTLRPGDRVPSIRSQCRLRGLSPSTVLKAYATLEARSLLESRPRAGHYVAAKPPPPRAARASSPKPNTTRLAVSDLVFDILEASRDRGVIPLGSAFPGPGQFPWIELARALGRSARHMDPWSTVESLPPGSLELRRQIARRYLKLGITVDIGQIIVTAGALEALNLALQTVTRPGDTIAIESPTFYGCLQAAERIGLKVVEIPTHPREGIDIAALQRAVTRHSVRACWFMTTLQHPTGSIMPAERKRELVRLLASRAIPLIEDDAYAELQFAAAPALPAKAYDKQGLVLHCGSFSKCLAPGYRLGWIAAGRFAQSVARRKIESSLATSLPVQQGIAQLLDDGAYEAHLKRLREFLSAQQALALASVQRHFPSGYRVTKPEGGYFLWIECPPSVDSLELHRAALKSGITLAPGPMFSARREFPNFIRLNYGHPWTSTLESAVRRLGDLAKRFG